VARTGLDETGSDGAPLALEACECQLATRHPEENVPTYQYACTACGHELEAVQSFADEPLTDCPACEGRLRKLFSSVGIVFKGSGFYRTDSRSGQSGDGAAKNGKNGDADGGSKDAGPASKDKAPAASGASASGGSGSGSGGSGSGGSGSGGSGSGGSGSGGSDPGSGGSRSGRSGSRTGGSGSRASDSAAS
jgi:putative FmdB family regulatory protein